MKKDKGVSVTKRDLRNSLLHREFQLYNNKITLGDGSTSYGDNSKNYTVQYNKKMDNVICGCKTPGMKHHHETRYVITTPGSYRSRNYLDVGVGSIRKLPKKRVRKVYLPETNEMGVGSTDLTPYFRRHRQPLYDRYSYRKTFSKGVGAFIEPDSGYVVSEKLSPLARTISGYSKTLSRYKSITRSDLRKRAKTLRDTEIGSNLIHNQIASASVQVDKSKHEYKTAYAGNSTVNQLVTATTQVEGENNHEYKSKNSLRRTPTKAGLAYQTTKTKSPTLSKTSLKTVEVRTEKILSSDTILQVHNLEINSEAKFVKAIEPSNKNNEDNSEKVKKQESKIEDDTSNISKGSTAKNISGLKSTSILKRRFDALRRTLYKKEELKKPVIVPSHATPASITSSQKSQSSRQTVVSKTSSKKSQPSLHKPVSGSSSQKNTSSRHNVVSRTSSRKSQQSRMDVAIASDPPSLVARSYSELFIEPNKISNKRLSKKSLTIEKQESLRDASSSKFNTLDSDASQGVKGMFKLWGKKFNLEGNPDVEGIYSPSYIKPKTKVIDETFGNKPAKTKEKKRFFFFKSKPKDTKKLKEKEKSPSNDNFTSKQGITTGRCEVKSGFAIKMTGHNKQKSIMVKKEPENKRESPGGLLRQDWLMKYSTNPNESCYSVKLRWNNGTFVTSSSTVGGTEKAYDTDNLLKSASELSIVTYDRSSRLIPKTQQNVNYMQYYQAWMIPRLYRTMVPSRSENYEGNIDVAFLDKQWFIDKSKAFADQLELILHTKNITKFNRKMSSEYITIDIPKDFFSDSSTGDNTPTRPIRMSEEEVYNIVEYETASEVLRKYKNKFLKVDHSVQGSFITKSMEAIMIEPPQREKKDKPKYKDMETQRSQYYDPDNFVGVRLITQKDLKDARKPNLRCLEDESDHYQGNLHTYQSGRKCECTDSYSQEYCSGNIWTGSYNNWVPMDLFSWCISDHKLKYCAFKESRRSISYEDCTKSCPNIHEDFITPTFMSTCNIISSLSPHHDVQTERNTQDNFKSVKFLQHNRSTKEHARDIARFIPKDSLEVLKKRKIYASRKNWTSIQPEKSDGREGGTGKKRVSLEFDNITEEILTTITSHSTTKRSTSKHHLPSDKQSDSCSLVSFPETISTRSRKSSKQSSLAVTAKQFKKFSYSSTPRLSPKQSNPKVSCSGLKRGVMGILSLESPQNDFSSTDCLRSSISKMSLHKDSDSKKFSVHTTQSRQNNPVSSSVKLSESQSLPIVVIESFKSVASKCSKTEGTSKASLDNAESQCELLLTSLKNEYKDSMVLNEQNTIADSKNVEDSLALNCEIIKPKRQDEFNHSIENNGPSKKLDEIINNINDSFALKYNSVKEVSEGQNNGLISTENESTNMIQNLIQNTINLIISNSETESDTKRYERTLIQNNYNLITSNSETESDTKKYKRTMTQNTNNWITSTSETESDAKKCKSNISLIFNNKIKEEVLTDIYDELTNESANVTNKVDSGLSLNSKIQRSIKKIPEIINNTVKSKPSIDSTSKSLVSKTRMISQKTSAISLDKKISGKTSAKKIQSLEHNVFNEDHRNRKISEYTTSMKMHNGGVVHINSREKNSVIVKNLGLSTEKIALSKSEAIEETRQSFAEIKHEINNSKEPLRNGEALTMFTDKIPSKTYELRKISKENNITLSKSESSIANIIEIDFKLKVIDGDQSTEVHIGNEDNIENSNAKQASQDVLIMNENEKKYPISDYVTRDSNGKKDINIKIMIKNFKSKTNSGISSKPQKTSKHYVDFSNKISEKFKTVAASDMYSTHKATVNLTNSRKSEDSIKLNNDISHHLSDIIMLSNVNKSEASVEVSDTKSATETRKKKMSIFGKITSKTKERFAKSHGKLSKCSESDTVASENAVGEENFGVASKTSNKCKSIRSVYKKTVGQKSTKNVEDNMMKLSEEFPLASASQSKYQERKELLKKVFQTANCLGRRRTKSRVRKLKSILKSILTSDSDTDLSMVREDLIKDFTDPSMSVGKSSYTSLSSVIGNKTDDNEKCCSNRKDASSTDYPSEKDEVTDSNEKASKGCACSTVAERFNKCGGFVPGGCCCSKPVGKHEETSCNLTKEELQGQQILRTVSLVDVETQKSLRCVSKLTNVSKHFYSNHQSIAQVAIVNEEFNNIVMRESCEASVKSVLDLEEIEIMKETEIAAKDNEELVVKTVAIENENEKNAITEVDNRKVKNIQENKGPVVNEKIIEEVNVTHKIKKATRRTSTDSKKIVITIDNFKKKSDELKIANNNGSKAFAQKSNRIKSCEFKKLDRNTKLGISDDDQIIFLESESTNVGSSVRERHKHKHRKREDTSESPYTMGPDVLQMYETKKAVLQIYAEKKRTANGEKYVANLPVFMMNRESEIYEQYGDLVKYAYCSVRRNLM